MYELLFRSRWYALGWALFMAVSAILFTTTGAGAWFFSGEPDLHAKQQARESQFRSWAEDDKRRMDEETGYDPSSPEHVRDGSSPRQDTGSGVHQVAPFSPGDSDEGGEDGSASR